MKAKCLLCGHEVESMRSFLFTLFLLLLFITGFVYVFVKAQACSSEIVKVRNQYVSFIKNLTCSDIMQIHINNEGNNLFPSYNMSRSWR